MSLQATEVIDLVVASRAHGGELLILDFEPVAEPSQRLALLREKLQHYCAYVDSGQYREQLPSIAPENILIRVLWHEPPTTDMAAIEAVRAHGNAGAELRLPVVFESEADARTRIASENPKRPWWRFW